MQRNVLPFSERNFFFSPSGRPLTVVAHERNASRLPRPACRRSRVSTPVRQSPCADSAAAALDVDVTARDPPISGAAARRTTDVRLSVRKLPGARDNNIVSPARPALVVCFLFFFFFFLLARSACVCVRASALSRERVCGVRCVCVCYSVSVYLFFTDNGHHSRSTTLAGGAVTTASNSHQQPTTAGQWSTSRYGVVVSSLSAGPTSSRAFFPSPQCFPQPPIRRVERSP